MLFLRFFLLAASVIGAVGRGDQILWRPSRSIRVGGRSKDMKPIWFVERALCKSRVEDRWSTDISLFIKLSTFASRSVTAAVCRIACRSGIFRGRWEAIVSASLA